MCDNKPLPPANYIDRVIANLEVANEDTDIEAAALVDDGTRPVIQYEYDEIFSAYMPRRADRRSHYGTGAHQDLIAQWLANIQIRRKVQLLEEMDLYYELGDPLLISDPKRGKCFTSMVRSCLPAKLDFSSWIGEVAKQKLMETYPNSLGFGELLLWEPYMVPCGETEEERAMLAAQNLSMPVVGAAGSGRLVWKRMKPTNPRNMFEEEYSLHLKKRGKIEKALARTEQSLVRLSVQISNWLGWCIWRHHVLPMAQMRERRSVHSSDIIRAVVEILGDEWFELPFDEEGALKQWKLMRSFPVTMEDFLYPIDPRTTLDKQ